MAKYDPKTYRRKNKKRKSKKLTFDLLLFLLTSGRVIVDTENMEILTTRHGRMTRHKPHPLKINWHGNGHLYPFVRLSITLTGKKLVEREGKQILVDSGNATPDRRKLHIAVHKLAWIAKHRIPVPPDHELDHDDRDTGNWHPDNIILRTKAEHYARHYGTGEDEAEFT